MKIKLLYTLVLILFTCSCDRFRHKNNTYDGNSGNDVLKLDSYKILPDKFVISYTIKNTFDYDIWVCDGINGVSKSDIGLKKKTLFLRLFSSLPYNDTILIYAPPIAYYSKLPPNSHISKTIEIELPIKNLSLFDSDRAPIWRVNASRLVLQVGYITPDELSKLGEWSRKESEDRLLVQVIRDVKIDEKILEAEICNVRIPVSP